MDGLTIGKVAQLAEVHIETLRYYEREKVVPRPPRTSSNYRLYPEDTVRRVRFVKHAQELGFSLKEIKELLALRGTRGAGCRNVQRRALAKRKEINEKIRSLQAIQKALHKLVEQCRGKGQLTECPILESLDSSKKR